MRKLKRLIIRRKYVFAAVALIVVVFGVAIITASCGREEDVSINTSVSSSNEPESEDLDEAESSSKSGSMTTGKKTTGQDDEVEAVEEVVENPTLLAYNKDTKDGYMNSCIFLGDSRTVAMVNYGFISDENAFAKIGIAHTSVEKATISNNAGREYTLDTYLASHDEPVIFVCYGVNGMNGIAEDKYKSTYTSLVEHIMEKAKKGAHVVLMSIWPVDDNGTYRNSVKNEWINKYNDFLYDLAEKKGLNYLDVSEILKGKNGQIDPKYDAGDGLHYKASAYNDILDYIIHHPVPGVSDSGEFVVHYVKPSKENAKMVTEQIVLPDNVALDSAIALPTPQPLPTQCQHDPNNTSSEYCPMCGNYNPYYREPEKKQEPTATPTPTATSTPEPTSTPTQTTEPTSAPTANPETTPVATPTTCSHDPNNTTSPTCTICGGANPYYVTPAPQPENTPTDPPATDPSPAETTPAEPSPPDESSGDSVPSE